MSKTTFRATISDEDFDWLQDFKDNNDLMNNTQVLHYFMKLAKNEKNNLREKGMINYYVVKGRRP